MPSQEEIDAQLTLLDTYRRRLSYQLNQQAKLGESSPFSLVDEIAAARSEIERIQELLQSWGISPYSQLGTTTPLHFVRRHPPRIPYPNPDFIGRKNELETLRKELRPGGGVWLRGKPGSGRTALLLQAAMLPETAKFPDGVVYVNGQEEPIILRLFLQSFFGYLFRKKSRKKVTLEEIRTAFHDICAVIILDQLRVTRDEISEIVDLLPFCAVLVISDEPAPDTFLDMFLEGLSQSEAEKLLLSVAGQSFREQSSVSAALICSKLERLPLPIILIAKCFRYPAIAYIIWATELEGFLKEKHINALELAVYVTSVANGKWGNKLIGILALFGESGVNAEFISNQSKVDEAFIEIMLQHLLHFPFIKIKNGRYFMSSKSVRDTIINYNRNNRYKYIFGFPDMIVSLHDD